MGRSENKWNYQMVKTLCIAEMAKNEYNNIKGGMKDGQKIS